MDKDKEVRFNEKKVDESWKDNVTHQKGHESHEEPHPDFSPSIDFSAFLTSLGYQALLHLGEIPHPETKQKQEDLTAAREIIDLLSMLETKSKGNRTPEEDKLISGLIAELQLKFAGKAG